ALQALPALTGVQELLRLDHRAVPGQGAAQQVVRRHVVVVAGPGDKGQPRLPDPVFIVAEEGLADPQLSRRLPLADALLLAEKAQHPRKILVHIPLVSPFSVSLPAAAGSVSVPPPTAPPQQMLITGSIVYQTVYHL